MDGHACMLRFLCEASSAPLHSDGFAGQLINGLLLTPKYLIDALIAQGDIFYSEHHIQGDNSGCAKPPVDKSSVLV